jgi:restriction system protein
VYEKVKKYFPKLTDADLLETQPSGDNKFQNKIRWARNTLNQRGEMESPAYGIWGLTEKGRDRLKEFVKEPSEKAAEPQQPLPPAPEPAGPRRLANLEELFDDYIEAFKQKTLQALLDLPPARFEKFAGELLRAYGFKEIKVTNTSTAPDGGIDGSGELKVGLASVHAAFQCKRWKGQVGRPEVQKFRGAIQGQYEHGYFFTTSTFSDEARQESIKPGSVPIFLFDGPEIVQFMVEKGLGVTRRPIEVFEEQIVRLLERE